MALVISSFIALLPGQQIAVDELQITYSSSVRLHDYAANLVQTIPHIMWQESDHPCSFDITLNQATIHDNPNCNCWVFLGSDAWELIYDHVSVRTGGSAVRANFDTWVGNAQSGVLGLSHILMPSGCVRWHPGPSAVCSMSAELQLQLDDSMPYLWDWWATECHLPAPDVLMNVDSFGGWFRVHDGLNAVRRWTAADAELFCPGDCIPYDDLCEGVKTLIEGRAYEVVESTDLREELFTAAEQAAGTHWAFREMYNGDALLVTCHQSEVGGLYVPYQPYPSEAHEVFSQFVVLDNFCGIDEAATFPAASWCGNAWQVVRPRLWRYHENYPICDWAESACSIRNERGWPSNVAQRTVIEMRFNFDYTPSQGTTYNAGIEAMIRELDAFEPRGGSDQLIESNNDLVFESTDMEPLSTGVEDMVDGAGGVPQAGSGSELEDLHDLFRVGDTFQALIGQGNVAVPLIIPLSGAGVGVADVFVPLEQPVAWFDSGWSDWVRAFCSGIILISVFFASLRNIFWGFGFAIPVWLSPGQWAVD